MTNFEDRLSEIGAAEEEAGDAADQGGGDGGDGAEEAFGVSGVVVERTGVQPALGESVDGAVEICGQISVGVEDGDSVGGYAEAGNGHEAHQHPIADQQGRGDAEQNSGAVADIPYGKADEGRDEVAEGDAGEDSVEAEVSEVEVWEG